MHRCELLSPTPSSLCFILLTRTWIWTKLSRELFKFLLFSCFHFHLYPTSSEMRSSFIENRSSGSSSGLSLVFFYYRMFSICTCPFAAYPYSFSEPSSTTIQKMESMERRIVFLHAEVCNWRLLDRMDFLHVFPELRTQYSGCCWFFHRRFNRWTDAKQKQIIHIFVSKNFQYVPLYFRRCR